MSDFLERGKFSCALGGALTTIAGLHKVVPIVHAAGGCAAALSNTYNLASGYRGTGYCGGTMIPTSNISEKNIVFGGEERLEEQIEQTIQILDADLYVVVTGCQVEIIGDDAVGIASRYKEHNVIGASTPGFLGNTYKGYDAVLKAMIQNVIKKEEIKEDLTINVLGVVPGHDVFYRGNLEEIKRLLQSIGVKANTFFGTGEEIKDIKKYGSATLNVVFSKTAGIEAAMEFEKIHDIPYIITELPIGPSGTKDFLRLIGKYFGVDPVLIESVIHSENKVYYSYLERLVDIYADIDFGRYGIVIADNYYAFSIIRFLANDLGWIPHFTSIHDLEDLSLQEEYTKLFDNLTSETKPIVRYIQNASLVIKEIRNTWEVNHNEKYYNSLEPAFVIGSGIERGLAEKLNAGFLSVAFPVSNRVVLSKGYVGFKGGITLIEDLISVIVAPR